MVSQCVVVFVVALVAAAVATDVRQCEGRSDENLSGRVQLTPCKKLPCKLKKGTNQHISINFTPETDMAEIKNHVTANVLGVDLPFVGVDGNSICEKVYTESGEKASCPVKAGTTYVYKDSFPILSFYPTLEVRVHWELKDKENKIACFEVPAKISN